MEKSMATRNGSGLQQAIALLIQSQATLTQSQATLMQNQAIFVSQLNEMNKHQVEVKVESDRRFARIEHELEQIKAILVQHSKVLAALPEAIRQKVGFKTGR
jgi:hypothetical protein